MKMTQLMPSEIERLVEILIADKKLLESRGQWVRVVWIPDSAVLMEWGQILSDGSREKEIATREYVLTNGQFVAHTTYHT